MVYQSARPLVVEHRRRLNDVALLLVLKSGREFLIGDFDGQRGVGLGAISHPLNTVEVLRNESLLTHDH